MICQSGNAALTGISSHGSKAGEVFRDAKGHTGSRALRSCLYPNEKKDVMQDRRLNVFCFIW